MTIELVKSNYSPTKAEPEEGVRLSEDGGTVTMGDFEEMGRALVQPVDNGWLDKQKKKHD